MIEELLSLAELTNFSLIFFRKPDEFYKNDVQVLERKDINIHIEPFGNLHFSRIPFTFIFIIKNIRSFFDGYSFVIGVKSVWWFLRLKSYVLNVDSIHAQFATQAALLAWLVKEFNSKKIKTKFSFTYHAYDIYFKNLWFRKLVNNAEIAFSISDYNIDYVKKKYSGLDESKIILSRLGTPPPPNCNITKDTDEWMYLGFISWFVDKKGIFYLLKAMKDLSQKNKKVKLLLAGDGPLKEKIISFIKDNGLISSVDFWGKINKEEKHSFFCSLDALVLPAITVPNDQDGIPVVLMEAVSYSLPLITTKVSGIPEICTNNYNGKLIQEKDKDALVDAIVELHDNPEIRVRFSKNSKIIFEKYNIKINTDKKIQKLNWDNS